MSDIPPASTPTPPPAAPTAPPPAAPSPPSVPPPEPASTEETDWKAEARKWETRSKENAKAQAELEKLKAKTMSETEKAVADAEARGRAAATSEVGQRLAAAEIRAALTGVVPDPAAVVEELNLARYLSDDGEVDAKAVVALKKKFESLKPEPAKPAPGQRPTEALHRVPVSGADGGPPRTDMSQWMRDKSLGASART